MTGQGLAKDRDILGVGTEQPGFQVGQWPLVHGEQSQGGMQLLLGVPGLSGFGISLFQQRIDPSPVRFELDNDARYVRQRGSQEFVP